MLHLETNQGLIIFIVMAEFDRYLKRRILTDEGWTYFCRICGTYKPQEDFYTRKTGNFRIDSRCKEHYTRKTDNDDPSMDYLKLDPLKENHFHQTQTVLQNLGYRFGPNEEPIFIQFKKKHNLE